MATTQTNEAKAANEATCKTCPFWGPMAECNSRGERVEPTTGTCRRHPPRPMMTGSGGDHRELTHENPEVAEFWWCGEHPLRQRDGLAAMAMQGILACDDGEGATFEPEQVARSAYQAADAMIAARAVKVEA
jgi:hypothetical protein